MEVAFETREDRGLWPASGDGIGIAKLKARLGELILKWELS